MQEQVPPQEQEACPVAERSCLSLLQHDERLLNEQQVDRDFFAQQVLDAVFEQQLVADCVAAGLSIELRSPHPQLAAGKDGKRSIATATQALARAMIWFDALCMASLA